jgi:hypothetical protein
VEAKHPEVDLDTQFGPARQLTLSQRRRKDRFRKRVALKRKNGQPIDDVVMSASTSDSNDSDFNINLGRTAKPKEIACRSSLRKPSGRIYYPNRKAELQRELRPARLASSDPHTAGLDRETRIDTLDENPTCGIDQQDFIRQTKWPNRYTRVVEDSESDADSVDDNQRLAHALTSTNRVTIYTNCIF